MQCQVPLLPAENMFSCWLGAAALPVLMGCSLGGHLSLVNTRTGQVIIFWGLVGWQHLVNCIVDMMVHAFGSASLWNPVGYSLSPVGLQTDVREGVQRLGAQSCLRASKISFIASSFCSGLSWGASVSIPLYAVQILPWSCLATKINAPARQMNPRGIGASNHEKWWRL